LEPFKEKFDKPMLSNHYLSIHPKKSMALNFLEDEPNFGCMQVVKKATN
jgi:hypothetical protein